MSRVACKNDNMFDRFRPVLEKYFPGVPVMRRKGCGHFSYMALQTEEYVN